MEVEVLTEKIEREAKRVARAFRLVEWKAFGFENMHAYSGKNATGINISWSISTETGMVDHIFVGGIPRGTEIRIVHGVWQVLLLSRHSEVMARGLYYLDFENENTLNRLPHLSAHEKLELRLAMPREFWPQKWLDEENKIA